MRSSVTCSCLLPDLLALSVPPTTQSWRRRLFIFEMGKTQPPHPRVRLIPIDPLHEDTTAIPREVTRCCFPDESEYIVPISLHHLNGSPGRPELSSLPGHHLMEVLVRRCRSQAASEANSNNPPPSLTAQPPEFVWSPPVTTVFPASLKDHVGPLKSFTSQTCS